ncbi:uncharacterized protein Dana_GF21350 [Drosophila ananassae]|uniref:Uncharacterized protein n=1 Tax=Drosophila ananassae TaxID=7217 RepID=B3MRU5_DROAN|nr:uncharacterized protein LOC6504034 [Drosophila ananassae]EDV34500.2 uncharacterized protein Dana_GF21350 [Drosophila ananassae]
MEFQSLLDTMKKSSARTRNSSRTCKRGPAAEKRSKHKNKKEVRVAKKQKAKAPIKKTKTNRKVCAKQGKSGKKLKSILKCGGQRGKVKNTQCRVRFAGCMCAEGKAAGQAICLQCLGNICDLVRAGVTPSEMEMVLRHRYHKWHT